MNVRVFTTKGIPPKGAWVLGEAPFRAKRHEYGPPYRVTSAAAACRTHNETGGREVALSSARGSRRGVAYWPKNVISAGFGLPQPVTRSKPVTDVKLPDLPLVMSWKYVA
jgi:hypothetical protein